MSGFQNDHSKSSRQPQWNSGFYGPICCLKHTFFSASFFFKFYLFVCLFYTFIFTQQTNIKNSSLWSQTEVHRSNHMYSERVSIPFSLLPFAEPQLSEIAF